MKVLAVTQPGHGHLNPMVPAMRSLAAAGHEVVVVSSARFTPRIEALGFSARAGGLDYLESEVHDSFPELRTIPPHEHGAWYLGVLFADLAVHAMVPDLLAIVEHERPDVLLRTDYEFASCIVGERAGIPHVTLGCAFMVPRQFLAPHIEQPLSFARSAWGLSPYPALDMLRSPLTLTQAPLSWHEHVEQGARAVRPELVIQDGPDPLADADLPPDRPLIYASMGTVNNRRELFPPVLEALRDEPVNLVVTVGHNHDPASFGAQPDNVLIRRFIPQDLLLPRCSVFVSSTSYFTVVSALLHGVPPVLCPLSGDAPTCAARFADLGVGLVLRQPGPPEPPLTASVPIYGPGTIRAACRTMLADPRYRARTEAARRQLVALPPWTAAVPWIERVARGEAP